MLLWSYAFLICLGCWFNLLHFCWRNLSYAEPYFICLSQAAKSFLWCWSGQAANSLLPQIQYFVLWIGESSSIWLEEVGSSLQNSWRQVAKMFIITTGLAGNWLGIQKWSPFFVLLRTSFQQFTPLCYVIFIFLIQSWTYRRLVVQNSHLAAASNMLDFLLTCILWFLIERFYCNLDMHPCWIVGKCLLTPENGILTANSIVEPNEARTEDLLLVHTPRYLGSLQVNNSRVYVHLSYAFE